MPIRQKDSDLDGDSLTGAGVSGGTIATSELEGSNLRYIAGADEKGTDTLTYEVVGGKGGAMGTVVILILEESPPEDFDGNFRSAPEDVVPFSEAFGAVSGGKGFNEAFDLNRNGVVDFYDFLQLIELWGP